RGGDQDVRVVKVGQLGFPVGPVLELDENGAENRGIVEMLIGIVGHFRGCDLRARLGRITAFAAGAAGAAAAPLAAEAGRAEAGGGRALRAVDLRAVLWTEGKSLRPG